MGSTLIGSFLFIVGTLPIVLPITLLGCVCSMVGFPSFVGTQPMGRPKRIGRPFSVRRPPLGG